MTEVARRKKAKQLSDRYRGAWASVGAEEIADAMRVKPAPEKPRTLADMSVEERRGLERHYGAKICGTFERLKKH